VAEIGGPRVARAGMMQIEILRRIIVALIKGNNLINYTPLALEGALKLSLWKARYSFSKFNITDLLMETNKDSSLRTNMLCACKNTIVVVS
jgi:hypothetical protein